MVECFLAKEDVAGSTPVSRSKMPLPGLHFPIHSAGLTMKQPMRRGTQVVRERSAKPLCVGSIPTRASNSPPKESRRFVEAINCLIAKSKLLTLAKSSSWADRRGGKTVFPLPALGLSRHLTNSSSYAGRSMEIKSGPQCRRRHPTKLTETYCSYAKNLHHRML